MTEANKLFDAVFEFVSINPSTVTRGLESMEHILETNNVDLPQVYPVIRAMRKGKAFKDMRDMAAKEQEYTVARQMCVVLLG